MTNFDERKALGDALEERVTHELVSRGWAVKPSGQHIYGPAIQASLQRTTSPLRWLPDLLAAREDRVCFIDCKAQTSNEYKDLCIERAAAEAHVGLGTWCGLHVLYVFSDLTVMTPFQVMGAGRSGPMTPHGSGKPYLLVPRFLAEPFADFFGEPGVTQDVA